MGKSSRIKYGAEHKVGVNTETHKHQYSEPSILRGGSKALFFTHTCRSFLEHREVVKINASDKPVLSLAVRKL